ncbi:MAG TPA: HemK2/MTQ2 family protein methyltransferase [Gammaproteobacteria bacterium]
MLDASAPSPLLGRPPGRLRAAAGKLLAAGYALSGKRRYDDFRLERVLGMPIVVMPSVANPKLLRTGAFFASQVDRRTIRPDSAVLDLGTGSGVCALAAARIARRVVAADINPAAVRCAAANALLNGLEQHIDLRHGDLFAPVTGERFDLVLFNPPFLEGVPRDDRDAAWRSPDAAPRFAAGLDDHLAPGGVALVLLSSFGDACPRFEAELRARGFRLTPFARRRFINETLTIVHVARP